MRLESIKLAGFKSFVDPTTLTFPSNLTAIVGPNGCGKSNVIDAIRWVMGESSAKQLRGQSLDDVIFNGSTTRKPLGQAAIELRFDNSDASLGGQYSSYTQIAIRREITRDGQSVYSLNGARCRRRDIRDVFLGTGLGPRSYAIIEQGMISRIVEAKPDELRVFIEEAAGISKYKERRHETENRLSHTQENLNRLNDLREELTKQAKHLQRQAKAAERYKALKQEERLLKAQLQGLRYRTLHTQLEAQLNAVENMTGQVNTLERQQQNLLRTLVNEREQQTAMRAQYDALQNQYYELSNGIARLEEKLSMHATSFAKNQQEEIHFKQQELLCMRQTQENQLLKKQLQQEIETINITRAATTKMSEANLATLQETELNLKNWQMHWDKFQDEFVHFKQQNDIAQTQMQHYQQQCQQLEQQLALLQQEQTEQNQILAAENDLEELRQKLTQTQNEYHSAQQEETVLNSQVNTHHARVQGLKKTLEEYKNRLQLHQGRLASLLVLQQEALGQNELTLLPWLKQHQLTELPRLGQLLQVESGWERAVEFALNHHLQAICCMHHDSLDMFLEESLPEETIHLMMKAINCPHATALFTPTLPLKLLSTKVKAPWPLDNLLLGVYAAENSAEALAYSEQLKGYETIITREGMWLGKHWMRFNGKVSATTGVLQRACEINTLKQEQGELEERITLQQGELHQTQQQQQDLAKNQTVVQQHMTQLTLHTAELQARHQIKLDRFQQAKHRIQQIQQTLQASQLQLQSLQDKLAQVAQEKKTMQELRAQNDTKRQTALEHKTLIHSQWADISEKARHYSAQLQQTELDYKTAEYRLHAATESESNLKQQYEQAQKRLISLQKIIADEEATRNSLKRCLDTQTLQLNHHAQQLKENQLNLQHLEQELKQDEQHLQGLESKLILERNRLEQQRLQCQELQVRSKTLAEQLGEQGYEIELLLREIPIDADIQRYETELTELTHRIAQLAAVNLAAFEEHQAILERKAYLDKQYTDLSEALATLQNALQKMDQETRNRFNITFAKINQNFATLFPQLFSGGEASLRLQNVDLPGSGVWIMAQPPGKRNSTIQLLSGGEKALTAIALVFAFFQLNPAPFCMLDEVDAPLDDNNVLRFCKLVKELAQEVQFIFVSHNKAAIEMAEHLAGITMHEPGVSRLVAVDMEKAIAMTSIY
jgi:chromosome segregation protein